MKFLRLAIFVLAIVLILAFAAASLGRLRRNSVLSDHAEPGTVVSTASKAGVDARRYSLDSSQSKFIAHAMAGGLLWFKGHDHLVAVREFTGEAQLAPDTITTASLQITARADSMVETSSVFTEPQKQIIDKELREIVLEPSKYPEIIFRSTNVTGKPAGPTGSDRYDLSITGDLTLHGVTRQITIPTTVTIAGNDLRATGEFSIDRGDFNVKATSAVHGLVRVRDKVKFTFDIVGHHR
jgi:polyisoprenoid-binding protein YceI